MRRRFGRLFRRAPERPNSFLGVVKHANQLMAATDYRGAASVFEDLARQAKDLDGRRTPFLFLRAGEARLMSGEYTKCMANFKYGLIQLADSQRYTQFYRMGTRIIQELNARKLEKEAQEINMLIHGHTTAIAEMSTQQLPHEKTLPPTHCPSCSGPLRADEVDWIDDLTAECPYCGSPVRAGL